MYQNQSFGFLSRNIQIHWQKLSRKLLAHYSSHRIVLTLIQWEILETRVFFFHFNLKPPCFDPQSLHCEMSPLRRLAHLEIFVISGRATQQRCSRRQCGSLSKDEVTTETGLNGLFISEMATICICTLHLKDHSVDWTFSRYCSCCISRSLSPETFYFLFFEDF